MSDQRFHAEIDTIHRKLDHILEEIELQQRHRREMEELKEDLMRVAHGVYQDAVVELDELHDHITTGEIFSLAKKILRNIKTITAAVEQLESFRDFVGDAAPLAQATFINTMHTLDELDKKGYFLFFREVGKIVDRVVTSFNANDVKNLGENVVTILNTVKSLTQPDMLRAINNALTIYTTMDTRVEQDVTMMSLLRELNSPEARRGLAVAVRFLKAIAASNDTTVILREGDEHGDNVP